MSELTQLGGDIKNENINFMSSKADTVFAVSGQLPVDYLLLRGHHYIWCLPWWLSWLRHNAHPPGRSVGGAGIQFPGSAGRFRVQISGAHAFRL